MRSPTIALMLVLAAGGRATQARDQYAAVALSFDVSKEEVAGVARQASTKHKLAVVWVKRTDDDGIEVGLADKPDRPSGITVVFRKVDGQWQEDPKSQGQWIV